MVAKFSFLSILVNFSTKSTVDINNIIANEINTQSFVEND